MDHLFRLDMQRDASAQSLRAATALALVCAHGYFIVQTSRSALLRFVLAAPMFMTLLYVPMMFRPVSSGLGAQLVSCCDRMSINATIPRDAVLSHSRGISGIRFGLAELQ
jgi:hypothetical protein